ncbi:MAG TPA: hypothetical protein PLO98_10610, partial [Bacteroidia bacterium]|nr:hypothetical protein [Bacteroidia bacterium]
IKNNSGQINYSTRSTNNIILPKTLETTKVITATTDFSNQEEINEWDLLNPIQASLPEAIISQVLIADKPNSEIKKTKKSIHVFTDVYYAPEFA